MNNINPYESSSVVSCQEYLQQSNIKYSLATFDLYNTVYHSYNTMVYPHGAVMPWVYRHER